MEFAIKLNANYEHFVLVMNAPALADKLAALSGAAIKYPLSFDPVPDDRTPAAKALREHFFFLVDQLSTSAASLPKFVLTEFEQTLIVMFLHASRHNYSHLMEQSALDAAPWQVRRAEEYIEASWQQAITLEDLCDISGVGARDLSQSFKRSRGYSFMEFADQRRLRHARELCIRTPAPRSRPPRWPADLPISAVLRSTIFWHSASHRPRHFSRDKGAGFTRR